MKNQKKAMYNCWHKLVQRKENQNRTNNKEKVSQNLKKLTRTKRVSKNLKILKHLRILQSSADIDSKDLSSSSDSNTFWNH